MKTLDNNKIDLNKQGNQEKVLYPDTFLLVLTAAFPDKYKNNEEELKKRFGGVKIVECDEEGERNCIIWVSISRTSLNQRNFKQIRLVIDAHGNKKGEQSIPYRDLQGALEIIKYYLIGKYHLTGTAKAHPETKVIGKDHLTGTAKAHPETKVYIENLSCHGANRPSDGDLYMSDTNLEKEIQNYFGKEFDGRIFYAKLANEDYSMNTFLKDNGAFAHIMVDDNYNKSLEERKNDHKNNKTMPAFKYYYLSGGKLKEYKRLYAGKSKSDESKSDESDADKNKLEESNKKTIAILQKAQKDFDLYAPKKRRKKSLTKKISDKKVFSDNEIKTADNSNENTITINNQNELKFNTKQMKRNHSVGKLV